MHVVLDVTAVRYLPCMSLLLFYVLFCVLCFGHFKRHMSCLSAVQLPVGFGSETYHPWIGFGRVFFGVLVCVSGRSVSSFWRFGFGFRSGFAMHNTPHSTSQGWERKVDPSDDVSPSGCHFLFLEIWVVNGAVQSQLGSCYIAASGLDHGFGRWLKLELGYGVEGDGDKDVECDELTPRG